MAQKMLVSMVDDLDGSEATQTVEFTLDGVEYAIDLSDENADDLRDGLYRYIENARKVGGRKRNGARVATGEPIAEKRARNQAIREWARKNGFPDLADRGRVPSEVTEAYEKREETPSKKQPAKKTAAAAKKPRAPRKTAAK